MAKVLKKGERFSLKKSDGSYYSPFCIGLNWSAIEKTKFLGIVFNWEDVDLDLSVVAFDKHKHPFDIISPESEISKDEAIRHSGDDEKGDRFLGRSSHNELLELDINRIDRKATHLLFVANCQNKKDLSKLPHLKVSFFEGTELDVKEEVATFEMSHLPGEYISIVIGKMVLEQEEWHFEIIAEGLKTENDILKSIPYIRTHFLE